MPTNLLSAQTYDARSRHGKPYFPEPGYDLLRQELERYDIECAKLVLDDLTEKKRFTRRQLSKHVSVKCDKIDGPKSDNLIAHSTLSTDEHQATEPADAG